LDDSFTGVIPSHWSVLFLINWFYIYFILWLLLEIGLSYVYRQKQRVLNNSSNICFIFFKFYSTLWLIFQMC